MLFINEFNRNPNMCNTHIEYGMVQNGECQYFNFYLRNTEPKQDTCPSQSSLSPPLHHHLHHCLPRNRTGSWNKNNRVKGHSRFPVKLHLLTERESRQGTGQQWGTVVAWTGVQGEFASFISLLPLVSQAGPLELKRVCLV